MSPRREPAEALRRELARLGAPRRALHVEDVGLMLAESRERPFSAEGWLFELKIDGFRLLSARIGERARLLYRRGRDATAAFPEIAAAVAALPHDVVLDGEVALLDEAGRPSFQRLQKRFQLADPHDVERAARRAPATLVVFDLLALEGFDLRELPLRSRRSLLERIAPASERIHVADAFERDGERLFAEVRKRGLEGIVAKQVDAPYRAGRSPAWLKIRVEQRGDFVVVGFTEPKGSRAGLGALHLGVVEERDGRRVLAYAGRAGSGLPPRELDRLRARLERARLAKPPFVGAPPAGRGHVWVEPELVCEVRYHERTRDGLLRQPVFLRLREDKLADECVREDGPAESPIETASPGDRSWPRSVPRPDPRPAGRPAPVASRMTLSNPEKVFWPDDGYTKRDLAGFYRTIAPAMLPYLRDRPLVLTRYPDGIAGKSFFQKDAPDSVPDWIRRTRLWSEHAEREIDFFLADDADALAYLANLGTIPIHVWSSRVDTLERPDWCILDLDPKGAPFADVVRIARQVHALCDSIGLPSFPKTSGASGLHVLLPLGRRCDHEGSRTLGELLARVVVGALPGIATIERVVKNRAGKVYVDFLQNGHGKTIVAPFSVRPLPGAPVSTPLRWSEVDETLDPRRFTIRTVPERVRRQRRDPLAGVLDASVDLAGPLERLARRLGG